MRRLRRVALAASILATIFLACEPARSARLISADQFLASPGAQAFRAKRYADALAGFQSESAERLLLVEVEDWRTDIYTRITLSWRLRATVFDRTGKILAAANSQGKEPVSRTSVTGEYNDVAVSKLSEKLTWLLNERQITEALR